tara:strand:- start:410 stop:580 length:171 start_codon:yes stop_codon:yes gene_type:complete
MNENKTLQLMVPDGMKIKLDLECFKIREGRSLRINGKKIPMYSFYTIPSGKWVIIF